MGLPILYGENTFTASSPSTSYGFDESLTHLPGKIRQCITSVRLDIDWADELWAKFPLLTKQLGELRSLQELEIFIKKPESRTDGSAAITMKNPVKRGGVLIEKDVNRTLEERQIVEKRVKMEGTRTSVLLNAEKKMFRELINGSGALRLFRLVGFADPVFAKRLEDMVNRRYLGRVE